MIGKQKNWFVNWFDSHYYHLLYNNRSYAEAEYFINNLSNHLELTPKAKVLDLACGKGRHAKQLNELGYCVLGMDLSKESIAAAKSMANENLSFEVGDMRELNYTNHFDAIFNLFTSFGYFQKDGDNRKVIASIAKALKKDGILILDYLNVNKIVNTLPQQQEVKRGDITFSINKSVINGFITKDIQFEDSGQSFQFQEFVKTFDLSSFQEMFQSNGLSLIETFGDYSLNPFHEEQSDRLILIAKKK